MFYSKTLEKLFSIRFYLHFINFSGYQLVAGKLDRTFQIATWFMWFSYHASGIFLPILVIPLQY